MKLTWKIIALSLLMLALPGCSQPQDFPAESVREQQLEQAPEPQAEESAEPELKEKLTEAATDNLELAMQELDIQLPNLPLPLQPGELTMPEFSIRELTEGSEHLQTFFYVHPILSLTVDDLTMSLYDAQEQPPMLPSGNQQPVDLSALNEADLDVKYHAYLADWQNPAWGIEGPRGTAIGDSYEEVTSKFLNLSEQYADQSRPDFYSFNYDIDAFDTILYLQQDIMEEGDPRRETTQCYGLYSHYESEDGSSDGTLYYSTSLDGRDGWEYVCFYMKDGYVVRIRMYQMIPSLGI